IVEFEVADLGLEYSAAHRVWWVGRQWVDREARARLFARVLDPAGARILWADQAEVHRRDRLPAADLNRVQDVKAVAYDQPVLPSGRWNKLVEPVVVTGIVVGLIVLFFSNQQTK